MRRSAAFSLLVLIGLGALLQPLAAAETSFEEVVYETISRLKQERPAEELLSITPPQVAALLTDEERTVLAEEYLSFDVDVPAIVFVATDPDLKHDAFWLSERGFGKTGLEVWVNDERRVVWRRNFPAGRIGLGVNSLSDRGDHYFAIVVPRDSAARLSVTNVAPAGHTLGVARKGEYVLADETDELIAKLAKALEGHVLLRGVGRREKDAHIAGFFRRTSYPASERPDQIVVTMGEDPKTSMSVQWRTSTAVAEGVVRYREKGTSGDPLEALAETVPVEDAGLLEDAVNHRHIVTLTDLEPATTYVYSVGDGAEEHWSEPADFDTAPAKTAPFSFLYMGDIQNGYDRWVAIRDQASRTCPEAAFCLTAGDQVNRGGYRDDWDAFFHYVNGFFADMPLAPAVGNHELYRDAPRLYLELLHLPHNGPSNVTPERAYFFEYGQVLVVTLDSNLPVEDQVDWLEQQLASSDAVWKFVMYHHPAFSSKPNRDNPEVRAVWSKVFDRYGVDIAFQGHDHGYMRTFPMKGGERTATEDEGTVYLVTVAGTKMYDVDPRDFGEVTFEKTSTFQVIDVQVNPHRLTYRAYNADGDVLDEFTIQK